MIIDKWEAGRGGAGRGRGGAGSYVAGAGRLRGQTFEGRVRGLTLIRGVGEGAIRQTRACLYSILHNY